MLKTLTLLLMIVLVFFATSCKKDQVKTDKTPDSTVTINDTVADPVINTKLAEEYLKEGFITPEKYRIVIVAAKEECGKNISDIESRARKRALVSLQRIVSRATDDKIEQNAKAELLTLVNQNGKFHKKEGSCDDNRIYYYEIEKNNLKKQIKNLSSKR